MASELDKQIAKIKAGKEYTLADTGFDLVQLLVARLSAQEEQIERLTNAVTACRPIIERLIAAEHNVETWGLKQRLAAIDAALEGSKRDG